MRRHSWFIRAVVVLLAASFAVPPTAFAGAVPKTWNPSISPSDFVSVVDNDYFPLPAGRHWFYRGTSKDGVEDLEIEVTGATKSILGITTTVVIERDRVNGQIVEISENWFAQDNDGTVWYFGEATQEYVNGQPGSTAGSWEAGQNGAKPGIIMESDPQNGDVYFQEFAEAVAEDLAQVMSLTGTETVPLASYTNVLVTKEWSAIESAPSEFKSYAQGVGLILERKGTNRLELVRIQG